MTVAIVDELEVIDVQQRQREVIVVARCGSDGLWEFVLECSLVGKIGQPVAGGSLHDHPMVAHKPPPAPAITVGNLRSCIRTGVQDGMRLDLISAEPGPRTSGGPQIDRRMAKNRIAKPT